MSGCYSPNSCSSGGGLVALLSNIGSSVLCWGLRPSIVRFSKRKIYFSYIFLGRTDVQIPKGHRNQEKYSTIGEKSKEAQSCKHGKEPCTHG